MPTCHVITGSLNLRYSHLATGRFLTVMPDSLLHFATYRTGVRVLPIELPRWRTATMIVTLKDRSLGPVANLFVDSLRELARPLAM